MATSQESGTSGLTQGMAFCSMHGDHAGQAGPEASGVCKDGWAEWTEETIQANFEVMQAIRKQDSVPAQSFPGLARHDLAFASWLHFDDTLRGMAYAPDAECPWRALGLDPATAATSMEELIDDRAARLNLMLDEAEHYWGRRGHKDKNATDLRTKARKW